MATFDMPEITDPFSLWLPEVDFGDPVMKAESEGAAPLPASAIFKGIASANVVDADGETIEQGGLDWAFFKSFGKFIWGHPYDPERVIGTPRTVDRVSLPGGVDAHAVTGNLWLRHPLGMRAYNIHKAAQAAGDRGVGMSIEGNALLRDKANRKRILKAIVYWVALDVAPKSPVAWIDQIAASIGFMAKAAYNGQLDVPQDGPMRRAMESFLGAFGKQNARRADLLRDVGDDDLRALRVQLRNPTMDLTEARDFVRGLKSGRKGT